MNAIYQWFTEPFAYPFMQNALITALLVSIICAMLSCYLVLKGWSLMGDAISHAVLPGIVVAFWLGLPLTIGAFVAGDVNGLRLCGEVADNRPFGHVVFGDEAAGEGGVYGHDVQP